MDYVVTAEDSTRSPMPFARIPAKSMRAASIEARTLRDRNARCGVVVQINLKGKVVAAWEHMGERVGGGWHNTVSRASSDKIPARGSLRDHTLVTVAQTLGPLPGGSADTWFEARRAGAHGVVADGFTNGHWMVIHDDLSSAVYATEELSVDPYPPVLAAALAALERLGVNPSEPRVLLHLGPGRTAPAGERFVRVYLNDVSPLGFVVEGTDGVPGRVEAVTRSAPMGKELEVMGAALVDLVERRAKATGPARSAAVTADAAARSAVAALRKGGFLPGASKKAGA